MLNIGDEVIYEGRAYVVVGVTPISVLPFEAELEDPDTGRRFWVSGELGRKPDVLKEAARHAIDEARESQD